MFNLLAKFASKLAPAYLGISLTTGILLTVNSVAAQEIFEDVTLTPSPSPNTVRVRGISGGKISARQVTGKAATDTGPCVGFIDQEPDHTMTLTAFFNFLNVEVQSGKDTTLVIQGPGGSWCNDDATGKNPGIAGQWLEGEYSIWVGSYEQNEYHPYVIFISQ